MPDKDKEKPTVQDTPLDDKDKDVDVSNDDWPSADEDHSVPISTVEED